MSRAMLGSVLFSLLLVGSALAALWLASTPPLTAHARQERSLLRDGSPKRGAVIELAEIRIRASTNARPPAAQPRPNAISALLVPCSDWLPVGPVYSVRAGEIARERHVQLLCPVRR